MKHVPERTCVACRSKRPQKELVRIVKSPQGWSLADRLGRGSYVCADRPECWTEKRLRRSFGQGAAGLSAALRERLERAPSESTPGGTHV